MKYSELYKFHLPEKSDFANIQDIVDNFEKIDNNVLKEVAETEKYPVSSEGIVRYVGNRLQPYLVKTDTDRFFADGVYDAKNIKYNYPEDITSSIYDEIEARVKKTDVLSEVSYDNYMESKKPVNTAAVYDYVTAELKNHLTTTEFKRRFADGEISAKNIYYKYGVDVIDQVTIEEQLDKLSQPKANVLYTEQTLTNEEKTQARKNIDALGAVEVVTDTIYATEDDVIVGYIKPDGSHSETPAYYCTKYIPINFDDNDSVDIRCSFIGNAGAVFFDIDKNVLLSVNGNNIADYGFAASSEPQTATITLPDGAVFVRSAIAADYYTKPEDFWISGKKTYDIIDLLEGASSTIINKSAVLYEKQALTNEQKAQARENIGAASAEVLDLSGYVSKTDVLSVVSEDNFEKTEKPVNTAAVIDYVFSSLENYFPRNEITRPFAEGEVMAQNIYYQFDPSGESVTIAEQFDKISADIGDIESLLGGI